MKYDKEKRIITASKDKILTNGQAFSSVGGCVYLGVNSNKNDWYEISEEEYSVIIDEEVM